MGNKPCRIGLRIVDPDLPHQAGDLIEGRVYFSVTNSADLRAIQEIRLVFRGEEYAEIDLNGQIRNGNYTYQEKVERVSKVLICNEYPVINFTEAGKKLKAGQYEYPFRIRLPRDLPSSMKCCSSQQSRSHATIRYAISAVILFKDKIQAALAVSPSREETCPLWVSALSTPYQPIPSSMPLEVYPIASWCVWMSGKYVP